MKEIFEQARKARILVVDDNPADVVLVENILEQGGYSNVHSTTDPCAVQGL